MRDFKIKLIKNKLKIMVSVKKSLTFSQNNLSMKMNNDDEQWWLRSDNDEQLRGLKRCQDDDDKSSNTPM